MGNEVKITIKKNKTAVPYKSINADILFGIGLDMFGEKLAIGLENKTIIKEGNTYIDAATGEQIAVGKKNAIQKLRENNVKSI